MCHAAANPSLSAQPQQPVLAFVRSHRRQTWRPCLQGREVGRQHAAALGCRRVAAGHAPDGLRAAVGERPRPGAWAVPLQAEAGWRTIEPPEPSDARVPGARAQGAGRSGVQQCQGREVDDGIAAVGMRFFVRLRKDAVGFGDALTRWAFASCWWAGWE